ncbi:OmpH family outer membrane protein [Sphingomonas edaphi]|jgi:Skp family chaperone for outer membrane proteins|uniref:OmpH family outer membrane protein n=1 Tax=Sphingomonas edaphi TaxID=2315689 RepID=A0A418Q110_9SPHN|nr:OmpH family outer membrane protein [Sphingomonas edaphi]RIX31638.1 OmpH family outer membrane protein [Sphingomonas edaphi]
MMTRLAAALVAATVLATPALAQRVPAAAIAVVDLDRVGRECNACRTAATALQSQVTAFTNRRNTLTQQLQPERQSLTTAVQALKGKQPDAALTARIQAFQQKEASAAQELERQQAQIQRNQAYISQQVNAKLVPLLQPAMERRGANVLMDSGAALRYATTLDITNDVLAALNSALTSVVTTAPAQPAQQTPQGR